MKVAVGLRRVAAGKRTSGRRAAQIAVSDILEINVSTNLDNITGWATVCNELLETSKAKATNFLRLIAFGLVIFILIECSHQN